ncbi:MAG: DUF4136 domain-containing protein [Cyclobacteriaceae bacterium]
MKQETSNAILISIGGVIICLILYACTPSVYTSSKKTKGVDLNKYKTYAWAKPGDPEHASKQDDKLFAGSIVKFSNDELAKKGFTIDEENPDAIFAFDTRVEDKVAYSQAPTVNVGVGFGGPGYYVGGYAPVAGGQMTQTNYQEGMLFIYMYDTKTEQLLWRGWAHEKVTYKTNVSEDIQKAIRDMFMRLPVKHK